MRKAAKAKIACWTLAVAGVAVLAGSWQSASFRYTARRAEAKARAGIAVLLGARPKPVSLSGRLTGSGAFAESVKGALVTAVESTSGYGVMSDKDGEFILHHLLWHPGAVYRIVITADEDNVRYVDVAAPAAYPPSGFIDVGDLRFDDGIGMARGESRLRALEYDSENIGYYHGLFERLAGSCSNDDEIIDWICRFVATRHSSEGSPFGFKSARQIIERGAPHCSNLAFAMAAITSAGGYPTRTVHTTDTPDYRHTHVSVEVFYDGGWHLFDPTYGVHFLNRAGVVASDKELRLDPTLISLAAFEGTQPVLARAALEWMPQAYGSGLNQTYVVDDAAFSGRCPGF